MARRRTLPSPAFGRARHTDGAEAAERRLGRCPTGIEIAQIGCREGAAGLDAAKIATIALHTALSSTCDEIRRCAPVFLCLALDNRSSGPPISLKRCPETCRNPAKSLCHIQKIDTFRRPGERNSLPPGKCRDNPSIASAAFSRARG